MVQTETLNNLKLTLEGYSVLQCIINKTYYRYRNYIKEETINILLDSEYIVVNGNSYEITHKLKGLIKCPYSFDNYWDKYHGFIKKPKTDKVPAQREWNKLDANDRILAYETIERYSKSVIGTELKYQKKAYTYLRDGKYLDEFDTKNSMNRTTKFG